MSKSLKKSSRSSRAAFDDVAATLAQSLSSAVAPVELSSEQRSRMRAKILDGIAPPPNTITRRGADAQWIEVWPRVWVQQLHSDAQTGVQMNIVRMEAGGFIPAHAHDHDEECLVLEGEIRLGDYYVRRGDLHIARAGSQHGDLSSPTGALLMIRSIAHSAQHVS
jgi:quercetin dioxygenase-like cupin family protein